MNLKYVWRIDKIETEAKMPQFFFIIQRQSYILTEVTIC